MIIKRNNFENIKRQNYSIAVGNFDGIHKGHKYLLDALLKYKKLIILREQFYLLHLILLK